ncbi:DUF2500 domain-containing protein [Paenibacillus dendritiformis]|uniref:DUF2500 domain-containing protein n=1 Tax=Paenibacillus dendritiformis C454 TaxID=1131935 RepID=H3SA32_9BACL|nr:DUF2500 domain-containing protein [Paenibacillus dendritiformis]EHQ64056.1 hypothetical protein PDENDC454_01825 [Paenibacillus dendritiformis C454]CAH8771784.1 DUF2500 domain-containing protein [Paenibacillus dendritiformis]
MRFGLRKRGEKMDSLSLIPADGLIGPFFRLLLFLAVCIIAYAVLRGAVQWLHHCRQPVRSAASAVAGKRIELRRERMHHDGDVHHHSLAVHYVAFRLEDGEYVEYRVSRDEFHRLEEGEAGRLLVRGARYVRFERQ